MYKKLLILCLIQRISISRAIKLHHLIAQTNEQAFFTVAIAVSCSTGGIHFPGAQFH